ncbi:mitochondrial glycoprotein [Leucogyrophana mollusca]|uniref:Mitochondrial glycoprotein n=1 Tax=Leucogyrophana mollusca TaxID=85980 RepID=A0ACB8BTF9_9AGAM|nr:mitochondrial glycoprotein [Leucogyrophana mollusca]
MSAIRALRQLSLSSRAIARPARIAPFRVSNVVASRVSLSATRAFSVSARRFAEGSSDVVLSQKLAEELKYEKEAAVESADPEFLKTFKEQGVWQIEDTLGNDEVTLTRKFGNENIRLMFSIADIQTADEDPEYEQEEGDDANSEDEPIHTYPIRSSFSITKTNGKGSINIDTMCQEGAFIIDNISFYPDAQLGTELTAEADWKRRGLYIGPQFDTLDVAVQEEFEKYLQERGINENLAMFIPEYSEFKEQKEYVRWLDNVKNFVDA